MLLDIQTTLCRGRRTAYHVFGGGKVDIVVEMGLGAVMGEWWHIGQMLQAEHTVLLYERAGYGSSERSEAQRSPAKIAEELMDLLDAVPHEDSVIMIAHSQGGLYAQQFARMYPDLVRGLILLDPLSADDGEFRTSLTKEEFKKSGVDKSANLRLSRTLARLRLGSVVKAFMKNAPPFCYYNDFSDDARNYILDALADPTYYDTAIAEYGLAHADEEIRHLRCADGSPDIPLVLITHSSSLAIEETMKFGGASPEQAKKVEDIWQELMKRCLAFSPKSRYIQAENSTHFIHLTQPELIIRALELILAPEVGSGGQE